MYVIAASLPTEAEPLRDVLAAELLPSFPGLVAAAADAILAFVSV